MISWINGKAANAVTVQNRGFAYADGLFETIAVSNKQPLLWLRHRARLEKGLAVLDIHCDMELLESEISQLVSHATGNSVLKLTVVRGSDSKRGFKPRANIPAQRILQLMPWEGSLQSIRIKHCDTQLVTNPRLKGLKTLNALQYVLAAAELGDYDEGVLCDYQGHIVEGTKSNLFWVNSSGVLVTPDLALAGIDGVIRQEILKRARENGIPVKVTQPTLDVMQSAREIFVTNSLVGVQSVAEYEGRSLNDFDMAETIRALLRGDIFETH